MYYSPRQYANALHETLQYKHGDAFSDGVKKFLHILKRNKSIKLLSRILREVENIEEGNIVTAVSARAIPREVMAKLQEVYVDSRIKEKTAPELLGGATIEWDDWRIDGSVRGRLQRLHSMPR